MRVRLGAAAAALAGLLWLNVPPAPPPASPARWPERSAVAVSGSPTLSRLFERLDGDHDGLLSAGELVETTASAVEGAIDSDGDGAIGRPEFERSFLYVAGLHQTPERVFPEDDLYACEKMVAAGQLRRAELSVRKTLARDADLPDAWALLSYILELTGRMEEARKALQKALDLHPDEVDLKAAWLRMRLREETQAEIPGAVAELQQAIADSLARVPTGPMRRVLETRAEELTLWMYEIYAHALKHPGLTKGLVEWGRTLLPASRKVGAL